MKADFQGTDIPVLFRGVRMHEDKIRDQTVLLVPEKAIALDPIGEAILSRVNGHSSINEIVEDLAKTYHAPVEEISKDVLSFLNALRKRVYVGALQ